ncbi:MAG: hypothetical protein PVSMB1_03300 [Gemmatimonadaceae bacterium]
MAVQVARVMIIRSRIFPLLLVALARPAVGQKVPDLKRPEDLSLFIDSYYEYPQLELIARAIELLPTSPNLYVPNAIDLRSRS